MRRQMMDLGAQRARLDNTTSAAELADMLSRIYHRTLISSNASELSMARAERGGGQSRLGLPRLKFTVRSSLRLRVVGDR
jgi:hypothetical protein